MVWHRSNSSSSTHAHTHLHSHMILCTLYRYTHIYKHVGIMQQSCIDILLLSHKFNCYYHYTVADSLFSMFLFPSSRRHRRRRRLLVCLLFQFTFYLKKKKSKVSHSAHSAQHAHSFIVVLFFSFLLYVR